LIDTLHLEIPPGSGYKKSFAEAMSRLSPETERRMLRQGRDYSYVRDLRYLDIPALQHVANRHSPKAGDKFEFIGAGSLNLSQMTGYIQEIYSTEVADCSVMRMDAAADLEGSFVAFCRENVRVAGKQAYEAYTPERSYREHSMRLAETIYWGKMPHQTKAYDKTGERTAQLQAIRRKMTRAEREEISLEAHFEKVYGYPIFRAVTRIERSLGARESAKAFGIERLEDIKKAPFIDPFEKMQFPEQAHAKGVGRIPRGMTEEAILYLRDLVQRDGIVLARNAMIRSWGAGGGGSTATFYRRWNAILPLLLPTAEDGLRREQIRKAYVGSTLQQIGCWHPEKLRRVVRMDAREIKKLEKERKKKDLQIEQMEQALYSA
jgi:hypothetical protein